MIEHRLYVGCIGEGVFRSVDQGASFRRAADGLFVECDVRALAVHPRRPEVLYLGSEQGLFVSEDGADNWSALPAPLAGRQVWSVLVPPARPERIVVGTCPAGLLVSEDGGATWAEPAVGMRQDCPRIFHNRVTSLAAGVDDPDCLWAGVEIDGLYHSADGGASWRAIGSGLSSRDIHGLAVVPLGEGRERLLATTNNDLNVSEDGGATWTPQAVGERLPWSYTRGLGQLANRPEVVLLGAGDGPPGSEGLIARSGDGGTTWEADGMPARSNSTMWNFATHLADPQLVYASSVSGQVYRSRDGGATWSKLPREFGEVRALAWAPG